MALDYASPQPIDQRNNQVQPEQASPVPALSTTVSGTLLSSVLTLDDRATVIEVVTVNSGAAGIKWLGSVVASPSVTTTNFDNAVPGNWIRRFVIPQSVAGITNIGSVVGGQGAKNGLYKQVAVIPLSATSPTSIIVTQY